MAIVFAALVFIVVVLVISAIGMRLYIKPKEALERVAGTYAVQEQPQAHPSLALHDVMKKLGSIVPASPKDLTLIQRRLVRAGYRGPHALKTLYGAKALLGVAFPLLTAMLVMNSDAEPGNKLTAVLASAAMGFFGPNQYIRRAAKRRQHAISRGLANALDLLVVCVESGLGLDQAIAQVAKELEHAHPEVTEEFGLVNLELKAGKRRVDALRNLADRTGCDDLKKLVAVLIQADRFGTGVAQSLRAHADYMRVQARQVAEEKAAKLGVKLVFPIFFCILPTLFVITVGPIIVKVSRELMPMIGSM